MAPLMIDVYRVNQPKPIRRQKVNAPPRSKACKINRPKPYRPTTARKHETIHTLLGLVIGKPYLPLRSLWCSNSPRADKRYPQPPDSRKSNSQLVEDLTAAPGVDESKVAKCVVDVIYEDANDDPKKSATMSAGKGDWQVHGGRLGRDHTLEDVPNHYLRDRLMSFTNERMPQDQAPEARRRVFSDLNDGEIAVYADIIRKSEVRYTGGVQMWTGREWRERCRKQEAQQHLQKLSKIMKIANEHSSIKNMGEAANMEKQEEALDHIDADINMTPHPSGHRRNYGDLDPIRHSVFNPRSQDPLPQEKKALPVPFYTEINYDCDQVRALVKRFVTKPGLWDLDKFRRACGLERAQLIGFLEKAGPRGRRAEPGFFRRREALGLAPFFDQKKADKIFPWHKVKGGTASDAGDNTARATKRNRA
ncbi:hypothetical protein PG994_002340 [Apiospora phragmitis]|uniref:DUF7726 domain-containing protein n=1 Tax=Apiospora phragmitis TaxID=2905665 RepID=A0ABR1WW29_9PEZI